MSSAAEGDDEGGDALAHHQPAHRQPTPPPPPRWTSVASMARPARASRRWMVNTSTVARPPSSPTPDPVERSVCPGSSTRNTPSARVALMANSTERFEMLRLLRNAGSREAKKATTSARAMSRPISRTNSRFIATLPRPRRRSASWPTWPPGRRRAAAPGWPPRAAPEVAAAACPPPSMRMRSQMPSSSGISLETSTTALPSALRRLTMA